MSIKLLPCPFCGHDKPEFERTGTGGHSCIVVCGNCGCRHESSDEYERSGTSWNARAKAAAQAPQPEQAEVTREALPPLPEAKATMLGDEYESFDKIGRPMGKAYENIDLFSAEQMRDYALAALAAHPIPPLRQEACEHSSGQEALLKSVRWLEMFFRRYGESANDQFERVAKVFRGETGYLRPGKDCRLHSTEEREEVWDAWVSKNLAEARAALGEEVKR